MRSALCYGAECWALRKENVRKLQTTEMRMLRMIRGKKLKSKQQKHAARPNSQRMQLQQRQFDYSLSNRTNSYATDVEKIREVYERVEITMVWASGKNEQ